MERSSTTSPARVVPLALVKRPPTASLSPGRAASDSTWLLKVGRNELIQSPDVASKAARYGCATLSAPVAASPFCTVVKLPPTYMVLPTWANAFTSVPSSPVPPAPVPVTPHVVGSAPFFATGSAVSAGVPESGIASYDMSAVVVFGRMKTWVNGAP